MKNLRFFSLALIFVLPLLIGTGCAALKDLLGIPPAPRPGISIPPEPKNDDDILIPTKFETGNIKPRTDEWVIRKDLELPTIYFSYDKFTLGAREKNILEQVAAYMQKPESAGLGIIVEGHCDERGSDEYNRALGERRALAVHDYLVTLGIPTERIQTQSFGEERPAVKGTGEAAYSKNRRAELILANMK